MPIKSASPFVPEDHALSVLQSAVQDCRGCDLYRRATQAVFGELSGSPKRGKSKASMMMIGEQPGDREDREGHPFAGPAGKLLDRCLEQAGIDRRSVYVTNTVKHFKWEPRGKLRINKKATMGEIRACRPWLDAELDAIRPELIVCLGAVAAQSLLGSHFKITRLHGTIQQAEGLPPIIATMHPSSVLRARTDEDRHRQMAVLAKDLQLAAAVLSGR